MGNTEHREHAQTRKCRQCSARVRQPEQQPVRQQLTGKRAVANSSTSTSTSKRLRKVGGCDTTRRQQYTGCIPTDRCGDTFAEDLGQIIDSILKDHANTLQDVIENIKNSQPSLAKLQRVSGELVQQCQTAHCCIYPGSSSCRLSCEHQSVHEAPDSASDPGPEQQQISLHNPPREAEKLNIGSPGKVGPNINDRHSNLHKVVKSVPDLVDLVKSTADDFGIDLELRPSAEDEAMFLNALYESTPCCSVSSCGDNRLGIVEETIVEDELHSENTWLQRARRRLADILNTREQLMGELGSIAGELGVQFEDHQHPKPVVDTVQRMLSEVSTGSPTECARSRKNPVEAVTKDLHEFTEISPEEI